MSAPRTKTQSSYRLPEPHWTKDWWQAVSDIQVATDELEETSLEAGINTTKIVLELKDIYKRLDRLSDSLANDY